jgi:hypothetical protein
MTNSIDLLIKPQIKNVEYENKNTKLTEGNDSVKFQDFIESKPTKEPAKENNKKDNAIEKQLEKPSDKQAEKSTEEHLDAKNNETQEDVNSEELSLNVPEEIIKISDEYVLDAIMPNIFASEQIFIENKLIQPEKVISTLENDNLNQQIYFVDNNNKIDLENIQTNTQDFKLDLDLGQNLFYNEKNIIDQQVKAFTLDSGPIDIKEAKVNIDNNIQEELILIDSSINDSKNNDQISFINNAIKAYEYNNQIIVPKEYINKTNNDFETEKELEIGEFVDHDIDTQEITTELHVNNKITAPENKFIAQSKIKPNDLPEKITEPEIFIDDVNYERISSAQQLEEEAEEINIKEIESKPENTSDLKPVVQKNFNVKNNSQEIFEKNTTEIVNKIKILTENSSNGNSSITLDLHPENLGKLMINMEFSNEKIKEIKFLVQESSAYNILKENLPNLLSSVEEITKQSGLNLSLNMHDFTNDQQNGENNKKESIVSVSVTDNIPLSANIIYNYIDRYANYSLNGVSIFV